MKKAISLLLILALAVGLIVPVSAAATESVDITYRTIKIMLNGEEITPCDEAGNTVEPFIMNSSGTTYLPLRAIAQALGLSVAWDSATSTVTLTSGGEVKTGAGESGATAGTWNVDITYRGIKVVLDGEELELKNAAGAAVEPFIMGGTTYLPLRVVGEALGLEIGWDSETNTASVQKAPEEEPAVMMPGDPSLTNKEAFDQLKADPYWEERIQCKQMRISGWIPTADHVFSGDKDAITAWTDYTYTRVIYLPEYPNGTDNFTGIIRIFVGEDALFSDTDEYDLYGEPVTDEVAANGGFAEDGTYMLKSGYNYLSRQLFRDILIGLLGEEGGAEAYEEMKAVFLGESYAATCTYGPSAIMRGNPSSVAWISNRCVVMELVQPLPEDTLVSPCFDITIYDLGCTEIYEKLLAVTPGEPVVYEGVFGADKFFDAYELDKW